MAALDFPNPPLTNGQQFTAASGITYSWDGTAWTIVTAALPSTLPPSGGAGGDLAGTYPNPTLRVGLIPTALPPNGTAGGVLAGTYPNPTLAPGAITDAAVTDVAWAKITGAPTTM